MTLENLGWKWIILSHFEVTVTFKQGKLFDWCHEIAVLCTVSLKVENVFSLDVLGIGNVEAIKMKNTNYYGLSRSILNYSRIRSFFLFNFWHIF